MDSMHANGYGSGQDDLAEVDIDLRKYWKIIYLHKWKIVAIALSFAAVAAALILLPGSKYQATATLSFDTGQANLVNIEEVYESGNQNRDYLQTQAELIQSRSVIDRVIDQLDLLESEEFHIDEVEGDSKLAKPSKEEEEGNKGVVLASTQAGGDKNTSGVEASSEESATEGLKYDPAKDFSGSGNDGETDKFYSEAIPASRPSSPARELVAEQFTKRLNVELVRNTQLIKITFESSTAESAASIANTIAQVYIQIQREAGEQVTQRATSWLGERLDAVRSKLEQSEQALHDFQQQENLVDLRGGRSLAAQELNDTTQQLIDARRKTQEIGNVRSLVRQRSADVNALATLPAFQSDTTIQELKHAIANADRRLTELSLRYGPKHPKMIAADSELQSMRKRLSAEIGQLVESIEEQYQAAWANEQVLDRKLVRIKREYQSVSKKESRHAELKRKVEIDRGLYNTFLTRVKETSDASGFDAPVARLADPASPPVKPVDIKLKLVVTLALAVGLLAGIVVAILYELLYDVVRGPEDVETVLGQNLFGVIPLLNRDGKDRLALRSYFDESNYSFSEAVRTLRTSLVLSHLDRPAKIISITSSVPGEGKTTVSQCLAFSLAQMEKVLLIDADLRRPTLGRDFGLSLKRPGLTNLIAGKKRPEECIYHDRRSGLDVMPAGSLPPDAQRLLGSVGFANHIKILASRYDRIIIDTPPVQAVSDALIISRLAACTLYVVKSASTRKRVVGKGIERLKQVGTNVDGVILSQVDLKACADYSSEYYGYYGDKYGYGAPDTSGSVISDNVDANEQDPGEYGSEASTADKRINPVVSEGGQAKRRREIA